MPNHSDRSPAALARRPLEVFHREWGATSVDRDLPKAQYCC